MSETVKGDVFDKMVYFAKATFPAANPWRTGWTTKTDAMDKAQKFCDDWRDVGVHAEASVFYRDGSAAVAHFAYRSA